MDGVWGARFRAGWRKMKDSLGLGSGADQGPWSSAASASTAIRKRWPTPTRRSSRATGKLWGGKRPEEGRQKEDRQEEDALENSSGRGESTENSSGRGGCGEEA